MGMMTVTPELLTARNEDVNLALIVGGIGDLISDEIEREAESFVDWFTDTLGVDADEYCQEHGLEFWDEVQYSYRDMFIKAWPVVADVLAQELPEIFGEDGPVKVSDFNPDKSHPDRGMWGAEREVAMFRWTIDGEKLWELAVNELGTDQIHDSHVISGFIRTCEDSYWAQCEVLEALMPGDFWYRILEDFAETNLIGDMMSFGRLDEAMAEAA